MTLRQMEYFLAVAEEGSFSRAAARLNVTQPALSQQVQTLESSLGAVLLERLSRGAKLTAAGRAYLPHVRTTLNADRRGRRAVNGVKSGRAGELELAAVISVAVGMLVRPLLTWHVMMPSVSVRLSEFSHRQALEDFVEAGGADLAIGPAPANWTGPVIPLGRERFVLIIPKNDPAVRFVRPYAGKPPRAAPMSSGTLPVLDLHDREWVLFDRSNGLSEIVERHLAAGGLSLPRASLRTSQFVTAATLASSGMGPTLIPANVVPADLDAVVCEPDPPLLRDLAAYTRTTLDGFPEQFLDVIHRQAVMLEQS